MSENRNQGGAEHGEQQRVLFKKLGAAVDSVCIALLEKRFGPFEMNEWRDNMREMFYLHDLRQFDRAFDLIFKTTEGADYLLECLRELSLDIGSQYYMPDADQAAIVWNKMLRRNVFTPSPRRLMVRLERHLEQVAQRSGLARSRPSSRTRSSTPFSLGSPSDSEEEHSLHHNLRISARRSRFYRVRTNDAADSEGFLSLA